jgi:hypothetical protein
MTGNYNEAVLMYQHKTTPNKKQSDGLDMHDRWANEVMKTKKLTVQNRIFSFTNPQTEVEIIHDFSPISIVKGRIDCLDAPVIHEWKSGVTTSLEYAQKDQIPFYFMLCKMSGINIEYARVVHFNQETKEVDVSKVYYSEDLVEQAINLCQTYEYEIYDYFTKLNIIQ